MGYGVDEWIDGLMQRRVSETRGHTLRVDGLRRENRPPPRGISSSIEIKGGER